MNSVSDYDRPSLEALVSLELTPREAEVLLWISRGKSNRDIAVILGAKTGTISKHVEHIFEKLNVENRTAAAVVALETCRTMAATSKSRPTQAWNMIMGFAMVPVAKWWSDGCEIYDTLVSLVA